MKEIEFLTFKLGEELFGIEVSNVDEVIKVETHINLIPNSEEYIIGVFQPRDKLLTAIDLNNMLYKETSIYTNILHKTDFTNEDKRKLETVNFIIYTNDDKSYACLVDSVRSIIKINLDDLKEVPAIIKNSYIQGIYQENKDLIQILNLKELFKTLNI